MSLFIRALMVQDLIEILNLYNHEVCRGYATWQLQTLDLVSLSDYFQQLQQQGYPILVAYDAQRQRVAGYAHYAEFRPITGFLHSVEHSIFIDAAYFRQGLGTRLLHALVEQAKAQAKHCMIAAIDSENQASIALHEQYGFVHAGCMREVGRKFGTWRDLCWMQYLIPSNHSEASAST